MLIFYKNIFIIFLLKLPKLDISFHGFTKIEVYYIIIILIVLEAEKMVSSFSAHLSELRKEKGISQSEAAKELGVSQALLSHYERGIRECGLDFLIRAAKFYSVSCDYILGISKSRDSSVHNYDNPKVNKIFDVLDTIFNVVDNAGSKSLKNDVSDFYLYAHYCLLTAIKPPSSLSDINENALPDSIYLQLALSNMQSLCASAYCAANKIKYPGVSFVRRKIPDISELSNISSKQKAAEDILSYIKEKISNK